jgi:transglutaminase-like putative cysteine protease
MRAKEANRHPSRCWRMCASALPRVVAILCISLCIPLGAAEAADYKYGRYHDEIVVEADGSYVETYEVRESPLTRTAVEDMGQVDLSYSANLADLEVVEAYVLKTDGRRIDVPADAMRLQDDATSDGAPTFTDEKHRIIIFPQLEPEDWLVYKVRVRQRIAYFPGHFLESWSFGKDVEVEDARIEISMPTTHPLFVDVQGFVAEEEHREGDRIHYRWTYRNSETPDLNTRYAVSYIDYSPRLHVSTMADYRQLAAAYESRAADKAVLTDEIRQLAGDLTKGITDRREQARRLYDWVNLNIRYVATYVGAGGFVPHAAADVLRNRYGDCKDHVILLEALLAAKGIESSAAILNAGSSFLWPKVPSRTPFNHAITYLPEFDLFVDSTDRLQPFGVLPSDVSDKPVMITKLDDPIRRTPPLTADGNGIEVTSEATLKSDGSVQGKSYATLRGPYAEWIRETLADASESQRCDWATEWLHDAGIAGSSTLESDNPFALDQSFVVAANFSAEGLLDLTQPGAFYVPESHLKSYTLQRMADDTLQTSLDLMTRCHAWAAVEKVKIALPENIEILSLPTGVRETKGAFEYRAEYSMADGHISIERRFMDRSPDGQCTPDETREQMAIARIIKRDLQKLILYRPSPNL